MQTFNFSVASLCRMLRRIKDELIASQSSNQQQIMEADLNRLKSYQVALHQACDTYNKLGVMDLPKSSPSTIELGALPQYPTVENPSINDLVHIYSRLEIELIEGQTSRLASGMVGHDFKRFCDGLALIDQLIAQYVIPYTPLDLPETSFKQAASGNIPGAGAGTIRGSQG